MRVVLVEGESEEVMRALDRIEKQSQTKQSQKQKLAEREQTREYEQTPREHKQPQPQHQPHVAMNPWTSQEVQRLKDLHHEGYSYTEIARLMGRTKRSVSNKVMRFIYSSEVSKRRQGRQPKPKQQQQQKQQTQKQKKSRAWQKWSPSETKALQQFAKDASNYRRNGSLNERKVRAFAKAINRSADAVKAQMYAKNLFKSRSKPKQLKKSESMTLKRMDAIESLVDRLGRVRQISVANQLHCNTGIVSVLGRELAKQGRIGLEKQGNSVFYTKKQAQEKESQKYMQKRKPTVPKQRFEQVSSTSGVSKVLPKLPSVEHIGVEKDVYEGVMKHLCKGNSLTYATDAASIGITSYAMWLRFVADVLAKQERLRISV